MADEEEQDDEVEAPLENPEEVPYGDPKMEDALAEAERNAEATSQEPEPTPEAQTEQPDEGVEQPEEQASDPFEVPYAEDFVPETPEPGDAIPGTNFGVEKEPIDKEEIYAGDTLTGYLQKINDAQNSGEDPDSAQQFLGFDKDQNLPDVFNKMLGTSRDLNSTMSEMLADHEQATSESLRMLESMRF